MGEVWTALHLPTNVARALKLIPLSGVEAGERFAREGRALARVSHPSVVRVHSAGVDRGVAWLAMDQVEGRDMHQRIQKEGPLPPAQAAAMVRDLARGLRAVHAAGVLHRDLKPSNVLFTGDGGTLLADFGLARVSGEATLTLTGRPTWRPSRRAGRRWTRAPMSAGWGRSSTRHSAGAPPFQGANPLAILQQVLVGRLVPPAERRPGLPPALEAICLRALERDPAARHASAAELGEALDRWLEGPSPGRRLTARGLFGLGAAIGIGLPLPVALRAPGSTSPAAPAAELAVPEPAPVASGPPPQPQVERAAWTRRVQEEGAPRAWLRLGSAFLTGEGEIFDPGEAGRCLLVAQQRLGRVRDGRADELEAAAWLAVLRMSGRCPLLGPPEPVRGEAELSHALALLDAESCARLRARFEAGAAREPWLAHALAVGFGLPEAERRRWLAQASAAGVERAAAALRGLEGASRR